MASSSVQGVQDLVGEWVKRRPDACAVRDPGTGASLTYQELWQRSGWLAGELAGRGVRTGEAVALALRPSVDLVVAFLGTLRAGAAYLPLDRRTPPQRLSTQVREAGARFAVCPAGSAPAPQLPADPALDLVPVPSSPGTPGAAARSPGGDDPAYVMYTSGSTGRPKGVIVPHRAVLRLVVAPRFCTIDPGHSVAFSSNPAFDASTFEVWGPLCAGGTAVVLPAVTDMRLADWANLLAAERITTLFLTTSLFHTVARERPAAFGTLRNLVVGGEQLERAAARRVLAAGPPGRLVNGYGPTETTTFAAYFDCTEESLARLERVPVGYPLQQTSLHVLDGDLRPVPDGQSGELCVGGPGVALGYAGRPDLTAQRFVPDPVTGATLYRTGDLARCLPGGALELLGRRDRQVKLRGFRIELEEIEAVAMATGRLDAVFVEKVGEGPAATLVGFALPAAEPWSSDDLRAALARRLPDYMIPTRWLVLSELPIGPTGKADRARLLALLDDPAGTGQPADGESLDGTGRALLGIWQDVLGGAPVRPGDNFVDLGGNSIMATQVATRIDQALGVRVEPAEVLLADSLAELAAHVRHAVPVSP